MGEGFNTSTARSAGQGSKVTSFLADVPPYQKGKMIFGGGLERFTGNM